MAPLLKMPEVTAFSVTFSRSDRGQIEPSWWPVPWPTRGASKDATDYTLVASVRPVQDVDVIYKLK